MNPTFLKIIGYLKMVAASVAGAGYSPGINAQGANMIMTVNNEQSVTLPRPPLKIPMPLDKAGYKVDVTFEVPPLPRRMTYLSHLIGLRILFTTGDLNLLRALEAHPVEVRLSLHRIEDGREVRIPLRDRKRVSGFGEYPRRYEIFEIPEGKATASLYYAEHFGAPQGTPNGSTMVMNLAGAGTAVTPGVYRFQVETLEDIPALSGFTSFFVYEKYLKR
ncbi:hypothetical protein [Cephaloticoccus capnophilus]|uniref:hypothetical protein n=1 Tax=Cephaloticoccus capnophilus TaxID=1548208 RepID=UPI0012E8CAB3|nr:hypothetical protein [Cephaloticoccus capnophilus]